jgi:hypothetical protein
MEPRAPCAAAEPAVALRMSSSTMTADEGMIPIGRKAATHGFSDETIFRFIALVFCMYCFRDAATGVVRYYLDMAHLSILWFVPDIFACVVIYYFLQRIVTPNKSTFGWILMANLITSLFVAAIFMETSVFAFVSCIKLFIPIFVGFAFTGRSIMDYPFARRFVFFMLIASVIGLLLSPHFNYPWVGAAIDNFGTSKGVGKIWWQGEERRYGGLAGDSTMAGFMCIFPYFQIYSRYSRKVNFLLWIPIIWALQISTSKTAIMTFCVFVPYYIYTEFLAPKDKILSRTARLAQLSFICVAVPFVLILLFGGMTLTDYNPLLFSMQDRINNSWQQPFTYLADLFPTGLVAGCGLGCFSYPMDYTIRRDIAVPVDNFYMTTYLMMGLPFIVTIFGMFTATLKSKDANKLINMALVNIYTITVQCYGPSYATLSIGYAFSDMFKAWPDKWSRRLKRNEQASTDSGRSWRRQGGGRTAIAEKDRAAPRDMIPDG